MWWGGHFIFFKVSFEKHPNVDSLTQEIKESVELPLTHPEYYEEMGIKPPKGVGPPLPWMRVVLLLL